MTEDGIIDADDWFNEVKDFSAEASTERALRWLHGPEGRVAVAVADLQNQNGLREAARNLILASDLPVWQTAGQARADLHRLVAELASGPGAE